MFVRKWKILTGSPYLGARTFRSKAVLDALTEASEMKVPNILLYNYPSFSGAFSALFAHLFHSRLNLPCLILPFSSVEPLRVEDLCVDGLEKCYFLDFIGPSGFAMELSLRQKCEIILFDHRKSVLPNISSLGCSPKNLTFHVDLEKSSSSAVYEYFCAKLTDMHTPDGNSISLLDVKDRDPIEMVLKYIEDGDLSRWSLPDIREFDIGLAEWRNQLNCFINPYMYEQLMGIRAVDLIAKGKSYIASRHSTVHDLLLLKNVFKIRLGRGLYGECMGVRADGNADLVDEICKQLSIKSGAAGLRPIGAAIYLQRRNLKMCLRSTNDATDTSEVAKAYGGGGSLSSSSFMIRMDEFNKWLSVNN